MILDANVPKEDLSSLVAFRASTAPLDPDLAAVAAKSPPRLIVVAACGGAGATTLTVLMAAALAAQSGALVVTAGPDRGALSARSLRLIERAKAAMTELSIAWDEKDQGVSFDAERMIEELDKLKATVAEGVSYLREPMDGFDE